ncbi:diguanylate cyclase domain-containing protein [Simplicispira suum]|uniref:Diguanylate cyclase n=1 Tax=Simplicispira suum TaxID=2109915 RepID=A0A2S0N4D0_9BURK|nr:diguanylate cyclase [Simplicispira suum]AVO43005.1 diguanylate cyclase [Simplicispira suum]
MTQASTLAPDVAGSLSLGLSDAELLAVITRDVGATVAVFNLQLRLVYCNDEYARWFGTEPSQIIGKTIADLYGEADAVRILPLVERVQAGERLEYQRLLTNPYGAEEWRTICLTPARNPQGAIAGFVTSAIDVHELQVAFNALRAANQRLSSHIDNSPLAVLEMDHELRLLHCSERAVQLMGWDDLAFVEGRLLLELLDVTDERLNQALQRLQSGQESQNREENSFVRRDGTEIHAEWFNSALTDATGRVTSIMTLVQDVSARVQIARQQHHQANHDALTGLDNRASFHERLERALAQMRPPADLLALLFIDLDGFKHINDQQGHQAGDEVLRIVAQRLLRSVREGDTVARLGGDEFLVMLDKNVTLLEPARIGQRIIEALNQPMVVDGKNLQIGASIGVAMHPPLPGKLELLMNRADQAMYAAKRAGKGRLCFAAPEGV